MGTCISCNATVLHKIIVIPVIEMKIVIPVWNILSHFDYKVPSTCFRMRQLARRVIKCCVYCQYRPSYQTFRIIFPVAVSHMLISNISNTEKQLYVIESKSHRECQADAIKPCRTFQRPSLPMFNSSFTNN